MSSFDRRPVVTYIYGPAADACSRLARCLAGERSNSSYSTAIEEQPQASIGELCERHAGTNYLYITASTSPSPKDRYLIHTDIPLLARGAS